MGAGDGRWLGRGPRAGHRSVGVGRIEQLFAGGTLEAPAGTLTLPPFPASAAGPDLRQLVLGSEGRLGILTEASSASTPAPERDELQTGSLPRLGGRGRGGPGAGAGAPAPRVLRLSTPRETRTLLAFAGRLRGHRFACALPPVARVARRLALLLVAPRGPRASPTPRGREAAAIVGRHGGVPRPGSGGLEAERFRSPYLRNALWAAGLRR